MNQTFLELLAEIEDFRTGNAIHYRLQDILLVSVLAVICNMDTYTEMAMFADHQKKYLAPFCDFRHGTPSHDTFGKVLSRLDPRVLSERFNAWMSELYVHLGKLAESRGMTVAIDGKTICRSGSSEQNRKKQAIRWQLCTMSWKSLNTALLERSLFSRWTNKNKPAAPNGDGFFPRFFRSRSIHHHACR